MSLVLSLLQAIVRVDGEALVMHAGDKPYVVTPTGQVDLASRGLNLEAVNGIVDELLPAELQHALEEFGAVQYELPPVPEFPGEHFTVVVARGGDDVWTEIRRRRVPDDDRVPEEFFGPSSSAPGVQEVEAPPTLISIPEPEPIPFHDAVLQEAAPAPAAAVVAAAAPAHEPVPAVARHGRDRGRVDVARAFRSPATADTAAPAGDDDLMLPDEVQLFGGPAAPQPDAVAQAKSDLDFEMTEPAAPAPPPVVVAEAPASAPPPPLVVAEIDAPAAVPVPVAEVAAPAPPPVVVVEIPAPAPVPVPVAEVAAPAPPPVVVAEIPAPVPVPVPVAEVAAPAPPPVVVAEIPAPVPVPVPVAEVPAPAPPPVVVADVPAPAPVPVRAPVAARQAPLPPVVRQAAPPSAPLPPVVRQAAPPPPARVAAPPPARVEAPAPPARPAPPPPVVHAAPPPPAVMHVAPPVVQAAPSPPVMPAAPPPVVAPQAPPVATQAAPPPVVRRAAPSPPVRQPAPQAPVRQAPPIEHAPPAPVYQAPPPAPVIQEPPPLQAVAEIPAPQPVADVRLPEPVADVRTQPRLAPPSQPAVVLPISRNPIRADYPLQQVGDPTLSGLERLLRLSAARGASTLYLASQSRSSVRVDGELQSLDGEPVLTARDVESLLLTLMPERSHEALRTGAATEWICDIEGVGRVRCMSFRDHRGPGGVFRLMPTRSVSVDQLGLPQQVQALAIEPEGLVLVAGPRSSGKRTLMSAFVDLMNHTRRDHVITIEREINIVHERGNSFISQREVRGSDEDMLAAARAALREDPDVLVIEDLRTGALMNVALEAAASGHLVLGGFSAHTATGAIDRIIDLYAPEYRRQVQLALADSLRGVIVQVLVRKTGGGRLPAREVLLNTPAVSSVIAEGKTSQLPMAIEGGRRYGMIPLNDALVGLVQSGAVDGREAYRQSPDRPGLLAALTRQGVDTSFVERLA